MTNRHPAVVLLLIFVTCGLYWFYWIYVTTEELMHVSGRRDLNPVLDVVLSVVTCGIWGIYAEYRNAAIVHEALAARGVPHESKAVLILILNVVSPAVAGISSVIATLILQDEFNRLSGLPLKG